ncbi:MAG: HIT family protein [Actinomycetes bacterium]
MSSPPDCVFCRIIAGEIPSRRVHADDVTYAFLDVAPWQRGHTLVVPRTHVPDLTTGPGVMADLGPAVDTVARMLVDRLAADGINLLVSSGAAAGQEVGHLHVHLVPRYADRPGLTNLVDPATAEGAELDAVLARLTGPT